MIIQTQNKKQAQIICNEEKYKIQLDSALRIKETVKTETKTQTVKICENKWHAFASYFAVIVLILYTARFLLRARGL